jgi:hypothetical protein
VFLLDLEEVEIVQQEAEKDWGLAYFHSLMYLK